MGHLDGSSLPEIQVATRNEGLELAVGNRTFEHPEPTIRGVHVKAVEFAAGRQVDAGTALGTDNDRGGIKNCLFTG